VAVTIKTLVNHPFSFAVGIGVANGLLAVARGKKIDIPTALWLSAILGLGEMALEMYVPAEERAHSLPAIGAHSVAGVLLGVLPFVTTEPGHHGGGLPIASRTEPGGGATAVSGWARNARRVAARRRL
jgi:hypothetical protein